jgi:hypothetical protein
MLRRAMHDLFDPTDAHLSPDGQLGRRIRQAMLTLLDQRYGSSLVCPSEAARRLAEDFGCAWQELMRPVRYVASQLADSGHIEALQDGRPVDIRSARGPIAIRLRRPRI